MAVVGHQMIVSREQIGMTPISPSRPVYGTRVRCSCGWRPPTNYMDGRVSNSAPSKGGRKAAKSAHDQHVAEITEES